MKLVLIIIGCLLLFSNIKLKNTEKLTEYFVYSEYPYKDEIIELGKKDGVNMTYFTHTAYSILNGKPNINFDIRKDIKLSILVKNWWKDPSVENRYKFDKMFEKYFNKDTNQVVLEMTSDKIKSNGLSKYYYECYFAFLPVWTVLGYDNLKRVSQLLGWMMYIMKNFESFQYDFKKNQPNYLIDHSIQKGYDTYKKYELELKGLIKDINIDIDYINTIVLRNYRNAS